MKKFLLMLFFLVSFNVFAGELENESYNCRITAAYINFHGDYLIQVDKKFTGWIRIGKVGDPIADKMYATALSGKVSNSRMWVRWEEYDPAQPKKYLQAHIVCLFHE